MSRILLIILLLCSSAIPSSSQVGVDDRPETSRDLAWTETSTQNAPQGRRMHAADWTGDKMIVWGGMTDVNGTAGNDGGLYDPMTNSWSPMSRVGAPDSNLPAVAVLTGAELIVRGDASGARYDLKHDAWHPLPVSYAPSARNGSTAIWNGSEMIVWGGWINDSGIVTLDDGARYHPLTDTWTPLPAQDSPLARYDHSAIWTGKDMIIWGGIYYRGSCCIPIYLASGAKYNAESGTWTAISTIGAPSARQGHVAVWTGQEMLIWGGSTSSIFNNGARYNPANDTWTPISETSAPAPRSSATAVWKGDRMIVWGGYGERGPLEDGAFYDPATDTWTPLPATGAPIGRSDHSAVWTGIQMIVWGGYPGGPPPWPNTGGILSFNAAARSYRWLPMIQR